MLRLVRKALDYYRYDGVIGVAAATMRRLLWSSREAYRRRRWLRFSKQADLTVCIGSLRLTLDPRDTGISRELAVDGVHEPVFTQLLLQLVQEGMNVVDVGANIGYYALLIAQRVGAMGRVIAFEPAPSAYALLQHNIRQNHLTNIQVLPYAIGAIQDEVEFFLYEQANWNSFVRHGTPIDTVKVPVYPLDIILPRLVDRVDLIRMDIEGYEEQAIQGMESILQQHRPILCLELHCSFMDPEIVKNLLRRLQRLKYEIRYAIQRSKDEVYWGRLMAPRKRIVETICINDFLNDKRFLVYKENFTLILFPIKEDS